MTTISKAATRIFLVTLLLSLISGCSERGFYDAVRDTRLHECEYLPMSEQDECRRQVAPPYSEYERERMGESN